MLTKSVRKEAVNVKFARNGGGRTRAAGIVAARADVHPAVGYGGHGEFDGVAGLIAIPRGLSAIPQLRGEIGRIVGVKYRRAAARVTTRGTILGIVQCPDNSLSRSVGR